MKKILALVLCLGMLCGCTIKMEKPNENNTTSNKNETTTVITTDEFSTTPEPKDMGAFDDLSNKKVIWGPGKIENHQQPVDPVSLNKTFGNLNAKWLLDDEKQICLTFDEGYENGFTPSILDTLKEKDVKAIFFVTYDFASKNPELIDRMINEGHIVGNHSYRHYSMDELDIDKATEEVMFIHEYMRENHNYTMSYFRFPKGEFSERTLKLLDSLEYKSVFWSFAYADWDPKKQMDPKAALDKLCNSTHDGAIFLLHAVSQTNAEILGSFIDEVRNQGYEFTVDI